MLEEAYEHAVRRGTLDVELRLAPLFGLALEGSDRPDHARAEAIFRRAVDLALQQGIMARACWSGDFLGILLQLSGRVPEAVEVLDLTLARARPLEQAGWLATVMASTANAHLVAGDLDGGEALMTEWSGLDLEEWARLDPTGTLGWARIAEATGDLASVRAGVMTPALTKGIGPDFGESMEVLVR